jgi:hypothetical protein
MGVSLESAVNTVAGMPGYMAGRTLEEWNAAYVKVETYFHALQVRNKLLLGQIVTHVLDRAMARAEQEPERPAMELACEEMDRVVSDWFEAVLDEPGRSADPLLTTRGRLALLLADMPGKWPDQFLRPGPWPEAFVQAMRESFFRAGPDFQLSQMTPRPMDLGAIATLTNLGNLPYFRLVFLWLGIALLFVLIFNLTH